MKQKIWANMIVLNEDKFVWFAIMSVIDIVDRILVWDTGSEDKTVEIIKKIQKLRPSKIDFKEVGKVSPEKVADIREQMLKISKCDWILILDGDEIWWYESIKKLAEVAQAGSNLDGVVVPFYNLIGDVYHYQDESAGRYQLLGKRGHLQLKLISRHIPGLNVQGKYPLEGYYDQNNQLVQNSKKLTFINAPYIHVTHLKRSTIPREYNKKKNELGHKFNKNFKLPEVFYQPFPELVSSPLGKQPLKDFLISLFLTPLRKVKRSFEYS